LDVYTDEVLKDFWARSFALRLREDFSDLFNMAEYTANGITNIEGTPKGGDQNVNALLYKFLARKVLNREEEWKARDEAQIAKDDGFENFFNDDAILKNPLNLMIHNKLLIFSCKPDDSR